MKQRTVCGTVVFLTTLALVTAQVAAKDAKPAKTDPTERGRAYTALFYDGKVDQVWEHFGEAMKTALVSKEQLQTFRDQVNEQIGEEAAVVNEEVIRAGSFHVYSRHARFKKFAEVIEVNWTFDDKGVVEGFYIRPQQKPAETQYLDHKTKTDLRLPFDGAWFVFWGGRTIAENYHVVAKDQRFAYDLVIMKDGSSHSGDGTSNEQYHAFGKPIVAPGAGVVAAAVDGLPDNPPGEMDAKNAAGNNVVIDHGDGEFSFLAHLQKGSVKVKKGQTVQAGDALGLCGNSGNTSEPHLHYHLQTTAVSHYGEGLPAQFQNYIADGQPISRGEPTKGQTIEHGAATSE
ncbi:MAG: M23 family metallopeptidase [Phycisphaerales bacterium]|nr:M23 family metallopeptidase [Phycisphaerales bacterium]